MAIVFAADLGGATFLTAATHSYNTIAAAPANSLIVVQVSQFTPTPAGTMTCLVGGSSSTRVKHVANGNDIYEIFALYSVAGVASGSAVDFAGTAVAGGGFLCSAAAFTGVTATTTPITTASATGTATAWSSGAATNTGFADALYIGGSGNEDVTNPTTSTATNGAEIHDRYSATDGQGIATGYQIVSTVASRAITGNWSNANSTANTGALAVYAADTPGVATPVMPPAFNAVPFIGGPISG